jgi:hypothetical protein
VGVRKTKRNDEEGEGRGGNKRDNREKILNTAGGRGFSSNYQLDQDQPDDQDQ